MIHETWRSPIPASADLRKGTEVSSIVRVKGTRVVEKFEPVSHVRLKGNGKGGVKAKLDLGIAPTSSGSEVTFTVDLGGLPLIGPVGKTAAMAVSGDLRKSLLKFREVFG